MALNYHEIVAASALRVSALTGTLTAALETTFVTRPLTTAQFQSTVFNFSAIKQAVVNAEEKMAHAIANTPGHAWRASLAGATSTLANAAAIPTVSSASKQIIGKLGSVYDGSTVCTSKPLAVIRRRVRNANSFFRAPVYHYAIDDRRIYHTRPTVVIDVCVYDRAVQIALVDSNGAILLPEVLEEAYICGTVSMLVRDDEFSGQAATYRQYFENTLEMVRGGFLAVPAKPKLVAA